MTSIFISDLHLDNKRPEIISYFVNFMNNLEKDVQSIYILGDFLEYWVGDDDPAIGLEEVFKVLKKKSDYINIYFMHGNRDFMISKNFCSSLGVILLDDPTIININNKKILLMHGDTLCTEDVKYQDFRKTVRSKEWQKEMLSKPLKERLALAESLRMKSAAATEIKDDFIMDVNQKEVIKVFEKNDINMIIHGHTHRPNIHKVTHNNKSYERVVLGDWYEKSFILRISNHQLIIDKDYIF